MKSQPALALGLFIGVTLTALLVGRKKKLTEAPVTLAALPLVRSGSGLVFEDGLIVIQDPMVWMRFSTATLEAAQQDGVRGPDGLLTYLLRRALPEQQWPPEELTEQWRSMVEAIATSMTSESIRGSMQLRSV